MIIIIIIIITVVMRYFGTWCRTFDGDVVWWQQWEWKAFNERDEDEIVIQFPQSLCNAIRRALKSVPVVQRTTPCIYDP
jgi:hypothetical protein